VPGQFPAAVGELLDYKAVILSDIGANSILLAPQTFEQSRPSPDRLAAVERYVHDGGGLLMIGGYLSFAGIEGKARYHGTPVEAALPVLISSVDDRAERPQGAVPEPVAMDHPVLRGVPGPWPAVLGYNRVTAREGAEVLVRCGADPLVACTRYHRGRSAVFTSDCAPHWAPPEFLDWPGYQVLWPNLIRWLAGAL
jgi:uncharacterized membrane protein